MTLCGKIVTAFLDEFVVAKLMQKRRDLKDENVH
jgi:hypothetical protein